MENYSFNILYGDIIKTVSISTYLAGGKVYGITIDLRECCSFRFKDGIATAYHVSNHLTVDDLQILVEIIKEHFPNYKDE
jgi:hypothetical protein